jgi:superfamily I DNA and RNA helicase
MVVSICLSSTLPDLYRSPLIQEEKHFILAKKTQGIQEQLDLFVAIHKSQGSEFPAVVVPLATQHYMLLQRNLIYTGITRGKRLLVLIGQKKALAIAVRNDRTQRRYSGLLTSLTENETRP